MISDTKLCLAPIEFSDSWPATQPILLISPLELTLSWQLRLGCGKAEASKYKGPGNGYEIDLFDRSEISLT